MPKPIELPPTVARNFIRDMRAFFAAGHDTIKADGIAAQQLRALRQHYNGKLRPTDIKQMFLEMRDHVCPAGGFCARLVSTRWRARLGSLGASASALNNAKPHAISGSRSARDAP